VRAVHAGPLQLTLLVPLQAVAPLTRALHALA